MPRLRLAFLALTALLVFLPAAARASTTWTPADKDGFGTARSATPVWYTLRQGALTEVYYPRLDTPSVRSLEIAVSDGTSTVLVSQAATHRTMLQPSTGLAYQQTDTAKDGSWRLQRRYVVDPARSTLLIRLHFTSLDGRAYHVSAIYEPALSNDGTDDTGRSDGSTLIAEDAQTASALTAQPAFTSTSTGQGDHGTLVQTGELPISGRGPGNAVLALGFGASPADAETAAAGSLGDGFDAVLASQSAGWNAYLATVKPPPASMQRINGGRGGLWQTSELVLAASEDKQHPGAFVASPSMPWQFGTGLENPSGAYHLVWSRDLYQIATALIADGDTAAANRALDWLFTTQQKPDGSFPQNSLVDGTPHWGGLQMDEVGFPLVLAWQLGRTDPVTFDHVQRAADFLVANGPQTQGERWENQGGWSPATIAAEIAGLVCAADLARANGDPLDAARWEATADDWQSHVKDWTVTHDGPLSGKPYFLRLTKDANPEAGTTYSLGDGGPSAIDQRIVVDQSFLDLVRLGILPPDDPDVLSTLPVTDRALEVSTPNGVFFHRYPLDGYGEEADGSQWHVSDPDTFATIGRAWPLLAGERGEYELAAGQRKAADRRLRDMIRTADASQLLPEQVWDEHPPSGRKGFEPGTGTTSATPLAWSHAQLIRLAVSLDAGHDVETPAVVRCRYVGGC
jgi:glucoamylase